MTMQVGMMAADGIVLASDTFSTRQPVSGAPFGTAWYGYSSSKIVISDDCKIAVTCARDMMLASLLTEALIGGLTPEFRANPEQRIRSIASAELAKLHWNAVECLVALSDPSPALFHLQCLEQGAESYCPRITDFAFAGDCCNSAIFWAMRYYRAAPPELRSVKTMLPLISQIVLDAGELNSGSIGGLEIICSDASGFHRVPDSRIGSLKKQAASRSKRIERLILPLSSQH